MSDLLRLIKTTGIYLLGNVLTKAASFLILPIITKYLSPHEYGLYDVQLTYITLLSSVFFLDIWGGILRFMFDYNDDSDKVKPIAAGLVIFTISTFVYIIATIIVASLFDINYVLILILFGLFSNIQQVVGNIARGLGKDLIFVVAGIVGAICSIFFNLLFIAYLQKGYEYLFVSGIIGFSVTSLIIISKLKIRLSFSKFYSEKKLLKEMLFYSLPLSINSMAWWFLNSYNRIVVNKNLTTYDNGLFAISLKFGVFIQLFVQGFQMAWQELTFSKASLSNKDKDVFFTKAFNEYVKFIALGVIAILPFSKLIFPLMIDNQYSDAISLIPLVLIFTLFSCISSFLASICGTLKITKSLLTTTIYGAIINVALIHVTISIIGIQAAALSLSFGYIVVVITRLNIIKKHIKIIIDYRMFAKLVLLLLFAVTSFFLLNDSLNGVLFLLLVLLFVFLYKEKISGIINHLSRLIKR